MLLPPSRLQVLEDASNDVHVNVTIGVTGQASMSSIRSDGNVGNVLKARDKLFISLVDPDNTFLHVENFTVVVSTNKDGELEHVNLYPTSPNSPVYTGVLDTCQSLPQPFLLSITLTSLSALPQCRRSTSLADLTLQAWGMGSAVCRPAESVTLTYKELRTTGS